MCTLKYQALSQHSTPQNAICIFKQELKPTTFSPFGTFLHFPAFSRHCLKKSGGTPRNLKGPVEETVESCHCDRRKDQERSVHQPQAIQERLYSIIH